MRPGTVHLVGAGPGDAGLLTLRAAQLLGQADVILHDRLTPAELLEHANPRATIIDAGKSHDGHGMTQDECNALLVEHARHGRRVVRLKGGDPYVFGRGSEELAYCQRQGIEVEVVPGVTSAIAGPALAGIPVTARGVARSFAVVTARSQAGDADYLPEFAALTKLDTLVVLMGCKSLGSIAASLIANGKDPATPAALVERASWPTQRLTVATLSTIAEAARARDVHSPVLLIVGPTAHWGTHWGAQGGMDGQAAPLAGKRIVVTRPRGAQVDLTRRLRQLGADVIECPLIRIGYRAGVTTDRDRLARVEWLVFTSLHGVRGFWGALDASGLDGRAIGHARVAAVGSKTAAELWNVGRIRADLVPDEHRAAAMVETLREQMRPGAHVLFPCGTLAREELPDGLRAAGASVEELEVYETHPTPPDSGTLAQLHAGVDAVLLYSPSGVRALIDHRDAIGQAKLICVGPTTAAAVRELKLGEPLVPETYGDDGVIELVRATLGRSRGG